MIFLPSLLFQARIQPHAPVPDLPAVNPGNSWRPWHPGKGMASINGNTVSLENNSIIFRASSSSGIGNITVIDRYTGQSDSIGKPAFQLDFADGSQLDSTQLTTVEPIHIVSISGKRSVRLAGRLAGKELVWDFRDPNSGLSGTWSALLRNNTDYVREKLTLYAGSRSVDISRILFLDTPLANGVVAGTVLGSPITDGNVFFGVEHPMSVAKSSDGNFTDEMDRKLPIDSGNTVSYSFVLGVTPKRQLRRGFQMYVQDERARPYKPFLHYNSWYDFPLDKPYNQEMCLKSIDAFGHELVEKRHVKMSSFLFDDGWDNYNSDWKFNKGFPDGFIPLKKEAAKFGAGPGVWLSPWGGYSEPREKRLAYDKAHGFEEDSQGLALSGPKYFALFLKRTLAFVTKDGINQFKFDGTGSPDKKYPGSKFDSDFDAAITLIGDLRKASPKLFINLTTGTWPSPFWLKYADSTWRGGYDHNFAGVGTKRQQWMTYRDGDTYERVVQRGPLYPINSLMLHGIIYAKHTGDALDSDPGNDFRADVRTYFANGTQLQEMYISPDLLTPQNWDDLAQAAKWSARNANILRDSHWVGGDPLKLAVYGWADWSPRKSILSLRNPSNKVQSITIDIGTALQLPPVSYHSFVVRPAYSDEAGEGPSIMTVGNPTTITLQPFQTLVLMLVPSK